MEAAGIRPDLGIFFHSGLFDKVRYSSQNCLASRTHCSRCCPVADPDLQIRWGGGSHPDPEIRGGQSLKKKRISALRASVWSKNRVRGAPRAPPLYPPLLPVLLTRLDWTAASLRFKGGGSGEKMSRDILKHMSFETKESTSQDRVETDCFIVEVGE